MWSTGVRVQISASLNGVVATGVGVETAFVPRPASTGPLETGSTPVPAYFLGPCRSVTATIQLPTLGKSISAAKSPGRGLLGDRSPVLSYALNGCQVAEYGPWALAFSSSASHTSGLPPMMAWFCRFTRTNPKRVLPGLIGAASAPVPRTESMEAPAVSAAIEPGTNDEELLRLATEHATPTSPTPSASRNCL